MRVRALPLATAFLAACGGVSEGSGHGAKLTLAAYSTPREVYEELVPAFRKTDAGRGVSFDQSVVRLLGSGAKEG